MEPKSTNARLQRLLAVLPRIYTAQPDTSVTGALLRVMASVLAQLDDDLVRVLQDRWVGLATGTSAMDGTPSALEFLGHLLEVRRLSLPEPAVGNTAIETWFASPQQEQDARAIIKQRFPELQFVTEHSNTPGLLSIQIDKSTPIALRSSVLAALGNLLPEAAEAYRQRIQITARILTRGLTTPRALLSLAIADLGADPCPGMQSHPDATVAWGIPLGIRRSCAVCRGRDTLLADRKAAACPNRDQALVDAWITENPLQEKRHVEMSLRFLRPFTVQNISLVPDRPVVTMRATKESVICPALQNRNSGEILLFVGTLNPGEQLTIEPDASADEISMFDSFDRTGHHAWLDQSPNGRAWVTGGKRNAHGEFPKRDVSDAIFYMLGHRFDEPVAVFGGARFGVLKQQVRSPQLQPGSSEWMLLNFALPSSVFNDDTSRFAASDALNGTRFALLGKNTGHGDDKFGATLLELLSRATLDAKNIERPAHLEVMMTWMARPPATFRLRVPKNGWVVQAERRGALALLRADMERARAAGVRSQIDFPEPVRSEMHDTAERLTGLAVAGTWQERLEPLDGPVQLTVAHADRERHAIAEGQFAFKGIFSTTRFNWSRLG